jgi:hypothetical protein
VTRDCGAGMLRTMRARLWLTSICLGSLLPSGACSGGTETGNPSLTVSGALSYTGYSSKPNDFGVREAGRIATIENAWLDLDTVSVSPDGPCGIDRGEAFAVAGLGVGDHAAGQHNSTSFVAKRGSFCRVGLPLQQAPSNSGAGSAPAELSGNSLLIVGELADGTPFSIASRATPVLELQADGPGFLLAAAQPDLLIAFDFAAWLENVDFAAAELTDGQIVISASSNSQLLATFESKLAVGVALYRDDDADGLIDADAELLAHAP